MLYALIFLCFVPLPLPRRHIEAFVGADRVDRGQPSLARPPSPFGSNQSATQRLFNMPFIACDQVATTDPCRCLPKISFKILHVLLCLSKKSKRRGDMLMMKMNIPCRSNSIEGPGLARGQAHIDTGKLNPLDTVSLYCTACNIAIL